MWIFTNKAFLSIVVPYQHDLPAGLKGRDVFAVRARRKADLFATFGKKIIIHESPDRDYRWRVFINRDQMAALIYDQIHAIKYHNFKDSIPAKDTERKYAYLDVWSVMDAFQNRATPREKHKWIDPKYLDQI